ncbi:MAG: ABC transporter ATP-binding protein [bacterium]
MSTQPAPVVVTRRLNRFYRSGFRAKRVHALVDIDLEIEPGEVFGFLGPNGAGKTSLIKILMGLSRPSSGEVTVFGRLPQDAASKARIGFLPESPYFYEYLTAREFLRLAARLTGAPDGEVEARSASLLRLVGMEEAADHQMRGYSRGMLQRIGIAQALIGDPEFVVLDEPMGGLDPVGRKEFRDIIFNLRERGKTVFFSTHILSDVEMICDRVGIIIAGRLANVGRLSEILSDEVESFEITVTGVTGKFRKAFERVGRQAIRSDDSVLVTVRDQDEVDKVLAIAREAGARVHALVPRRKTLEDHFMQYVRRKDEAR